MKFQWALEAMLGGKRVTRKSFAVPWSKFTQNFWVEDHYGRPLLRSLFSGALTAEDLYADDWEEHS